MFNQHIEIANLRKLLAVRVDLAEKTTVFVEANNSGKTSAMLALRRFLVSRQNQFSVHDLTLSHWGAMNLIGGAWIKVLHDNIPADVTSESWTSGGWKAHAFAANLSAIRRRSGG
jgi:recombinational DNA repair ATPase RecF